MVSLVRDCQEFCVVLQILLAININIENRINTAPRSNLTYFFWKDLRYYSSIYRFNRCHKGRAQTKTGLKKLVSRDNYSLSYRLIMTFGWCAHARPLNQSDFFPLDEEDRTRALTERLKDLWNYEVHQCSTTPGEQPKLWKCLLRMLSYREMIFLLSFWFLESIFLLLVPLGLGLLLALLTATEPNRPLIYGCCLFIGMAGVFSATTHYSAFKSDVVGMRFAAAIRGIIYKKVK